MFPNKGAVSEYINQRLQVQHGSRTRDNGSSQSKRENKKAAIVERNSERKFKYKKTKTMKDLEHLAMSLSSSGKSPREQRSNLNDFSSNEEDNPGPKNHLVGPRDPPRQKKCHIKVQTEYEPIIDYPRHIRISSAQPNIHEANNMMRE